MTETPEQKFERVAVQNRLTNAMKAMRLLENCTDARGYVATPKRRDEVIHQLNQSFKGVQIAWGVLTETPVVPVASQPHVQTSPPGSIADFLDPMEHDIGRLCDVIYQATIRLDAEAERRGLKDVTPAGLPR